MTIQFAVFGEPVAQGRPRAGKDWNGKTVLYDPAKSRNFKEYVKVAASQHRPDKLLEGPLHVTIKVYKPMLKKFSKKKLAEAEAGILRPVTKPDVDNYVKGIKDALNKVIWNDDSQVVDLNVSKFYSKSPRVEVFVEELTTSNNSSMV